MMPLAVIVASTVDADLEKQIMERFVKVKGSVK